MASATNSDLTSGLLEARFQARLSRLALHSRSLRTGRERGQHAAQHVGVGIEFVEHRPYTAGDDLRFVDFHAYARSDRLLIKQFQETRDVTLHILLDCSASMAYGDGHKLRYAKQLAAALGYVALSGLDRLSIQAFANGLGPRLAPTRGHGRVLHMLRFLDGIPAVGTTRFADASHSFVRREQQRGLAVVISDGYDPQIIRGIDILRYARFEPVLIIVRSPSDETPVAMGTHVLRDCEDGELRSVEVNARSLSEYRARVSSHFSQLQLAMRERQVNAFELSTSMPFDTALIALLRRGGLFR